MDPSSSHPKGIYYDFNAWGPAVWTTMHIFTFSYPNTPTQTDKDQAVKFFELVPVFLPCGICSMHFIETLKALPLNDDVLQSRESLSRWLNTVHNQVNRRLKKREITYEEALDIFIHRGIDSSTKKAPNHYRVLIIVMAICLVLALGAIAFLITAFRKP